MSKSKKHVITYKQGEEWIYDIVEKRSAKGVWIKDVLAAYLRGELVPSGVFGGIVYSKPSQDVKILPTFNVDDELKSIL